MFMFIPDNFLKPVQCSTTFCMDTSTVLADGMPFCLQHGTNVLLTGSLPPASASVTYA
jgi:hypothetical protein